MTDTAKRFRFVVIFLENGEILGSNSEADVEDFIKSDEYIVLEVNEDGEVVALDLDGEETVIEEL